MLGVLHAHAGVSEPRALDAIKTEIVDEFGDDYPTYGLLVEWVDAEKAAVLTDLRAKVEDLRAMQIDEAGFSALTDVLALLEPT